MARNKNDSVGHKRAYAQKAKGMKEVSENIHDYLCIIIRGRVHGVSFRLTAKQKARELGIKGFVCNRDDGSVYIEAEGDREALDGFVSWCRIGPPVAQVQSVEVSTAPRKTFFDFVISSACP
jgi:acylphosphatase